MSLFGGIFDFDHKSERLEEVVRELESSTIWNNPEQAQALGRERTQLEAIVLSLTRLKQSVLDFSELFELARTENDEQTINDLANELTAVEAEVSGLEFRRMFSGTMDA
ncbi:MAG: PCRF domain-containing protein, partial [Legionella sp.]